MPPLPPLPVDKEGRQDVLLLKQQLAEALGENGPSYWQALMDFVCGKLNRQEFDFYANLYLSQKHAHLHNQFILANLHNAQREAPPPSTKSVDWAKGRKGKDGKPIKEKDPKRRKIKNQVMSLGKAERERIKGLKDKHKNGAGGKQKLREHRVLKPLAPPLTQPAMITEYNKGAHAPLCFDSKELPDIESMKDRMTAIAMENGLMGGAQDAAVELVLHALESHLKSIISNCIIKLRSNRALGINIPKRDAAQISNRSEDQNNNSGSSGHGLAGTVAVAGTGAVGGGASGGVGAGGVGGSGGGGGGGGSSSSGNYRTSNPGLTGAPTSIAGPSAKKSNTITTKDLAFAINVSPSMLVETPINVEKLLSLMMEDSDDDEDIAMDDDDEMLSDSAVDL